jgi:hypothetical protein
MKVGQSHPASVVFIYPDRGLVSRPPLVHSQYGLPRQRLVFGFGKKTDDHDTKQE